MANIRVSLISQLHPMLAGTAKLHSYGLQNFSTSQVYEQPMIILVLQFPSKDFYCLEHSQTIIAKVTKVKQKYLE